MLMQQLIETAILRSQVPAIRGQFLAINTDVRLSGDEVRTLAAGIREWVPPTGYGLFELARRVTGRLGEEWGETYFFVQSECGGRVLKVEERFSLDLTDDRLVLVPDRDLPEWLPQALAGQVLKGK